MMLVYFKYLCTLQRKLSHCWLPEQCLCRNYGNVGFPGKGLCCTEASWLDVGLVRCFNQSIVLLWRRVSAMFAVSVELPVAMICRIWLLLAVLGSKFFGCLIPWNPGCVFVLIALRAVLRGASSCDNKLDGRICKCTKVMSHYAILYRCLPYSIPGATWICGYDQMHNTFYL